MVNRFSKIVLFGLLLATLAIPAAAEHGFSDGAVTITFRAGDYGMEQTPHGTKISMEQCGYRGVPGEPALPVRSLPAQTLQPSSYKLQYQVPFSCFFLL